MTPNSSSAARNTERNIDNGIEQGEAVSHRSAFSHFGEAVASENILLEKNASGFNFHPDTHQICSNEDAATDDEDDRNMEMMNICELESPTIIGAKRKSKDFVVVEVPRMSAADFELQVCARIGQIQSSLRQSAGRYEQAIEKTAEIVKLCTKTRKKVKKHKRQRTKLLNESFQVIVSDLRRTGAFRPRPIKDPRPAWR